MRSTRAMRRGARATYFKYELDQVYDGATYPLAGPAFGIRGYDNLFFLHYQATLDKIVLREVEDGSQPIWRASDDYTMTTSNTYRYRIEVTLNGSNAEMDLTMIENPGMGETVTPLFSTPVNLTNLGYTSGHVGAAGYAVTSTLLFENANLWIDDDSGGTMNDQVFSDDFASAGITATYDDNGDGETRCS